MKEDESICCPEFDPKKYNNKKVVWKGKLFVKDKSFSFFHIPLNFNSTISEIIKRLKNEKAYDAKDTMVLTDENHSFYSNVYVSAKKPIKGMLDVKVSGTFFTKVFEGPYKNKKDWAKETRDYVKAQGKEIKNLYFYYPRCSAKAKEGEKNYLVIFAEI